MYRSLKIYIGLDHHLYIRDSYGMGNVVWRSPWMVKL